MHIIHTIKYWRMFHKCKKKSWHNKLLPLATGLLHQPNQMGTTTGRYVVPSPWHHLLAWYSNESIGFFYSHHQYLSNWRMSWHATSNFSTQNYSEIRLPYSKGGTSQAIRPSQQILLQILISICTNGGSWVPITSIPNSKVLHSCTLTTE